MNNIFTKEDILYICEKTASIYVHMCYTLFKKRPSMFYIEKDEFSIKFYSRSDGNTYAVISTADSDKENKLIIEQYDINFIDLFNTVKDIKEKSNTRQELINHFTD